jgi:NTE family protein
MFQPVKIGDRLLVDGLLGHSVPAMPLRDMGADRVISVYLAAHWVKPGGPRHVFDVIGQCFSIAQARMCGSWQSASDLVLQPEIGGFAYDDFVRAPELIHAGEMAAREIVPKLHEWLPASPQLQIAGPVETALPTLATEPVSIKS